MKVQAQAWKANQQTSMTFAQKHAKARKKARQKMFTSACIALSVAGGLGASVAAIIPNMNIKADQTVNTKPLADTAEDTVAKSVLNGTYVEQKKPVENLTGDAQAGATNDKKAVVKDLAEKKGRVTRGAWEAADVVNNSGDAMIRRMKEAEKAQKAERDRQAKIEKETREAREKANADVEKARKELADEKAKLEEQKKTDKYRVHRISQSTTPQVLEVRPEQEQPKRDTREKKERVYPEDKPKKTPDFDLSQTVDAQQNKKDMGKVKLP